VSLSAKKLACNLDTTINWDASKRGPLGRFATPGCRKTLRCTYPPPEAPQGKTVYTECSITERAKGRWHMNKVKYAWVWRSSFSKTGIMHRSVGGGLVMVRSFESLHNAGSAKSRSINSISTSSHAVGQLWPQRVLQYLRRHISTVA
jgi:hypothetical protein